MIETQNKSDYKKLENLFTAVAKDINLKKVSNSYIQDKYSKDIISETKKAFGIWVNLKIVDNPNVIYCMPSPITASSSFLSPDVRESLKDTTGDEFSSKKANKIMKLLEKNPGKVYPAKAKLGGGFSKIPHLVVLDFTRLIKHIGMTGEQALAGYFHEIGHLYSFMAYSYRTTSTNLFMLNTTTALKNEGKNFNMREFTVKIKKDASEAGLSEDIYKSLKTADTREAYSLQLARAMGDIAVSDIGAANVDGLEAERVADAFVTKLGYGKDLAMAIIAIEVTGISYDKSGRRVQREMVRTTKWSLVSFLASVAVIAFLIPVYLMAAIYIILYTIVKAIMYAFKVLLTKARIINTTEKEESYDQLQSRMNKIYRSNIKLLKDSNMSKQDRTLLISDLVFLKEVVDDLAKEDVPNSLFISFSLIMKYPLRTPNNKTNMNAFMNSVEDLSSNDLYLTSALYSPTIL